METKVCLKCGIAKAAIFFRASRNTCKDCTKKYNKHYRADHADFIKEYEKKYRLTHKEKIHEYNTNYYLNNKEKELKRSKQYQEINKIKFTAKHIEYLSKNKRKVSEQKKKHYNEIKDSELIRASKYYFNNRVARANYKKQYQKTPKGKLVIARATSKRRSKDKTSTNTLTVSQWNKILQMQHNRCAICKREFTTKLAPTKDHIIPVSKGGGLTFGNTQALCKSCNSKKSAKVDFCNAITTFLSGACECN